MNRFLFLILIFGIISGNISKAQDTENDSLSLSEVIQLIITTHPSVKASEETVKNTENNISLARSGYFPDADMMASFSNQGPVTKLTIPDMGTFQLFPENNYSASVNLRQRVYDFGRTRQNIEVEKENRTLNEIGAENVKQKLSLSAVNVFYTLVYLQAAISIKEEQIEALNGHLSYINKLMETGSATEYQALSTKVRISNIESQKVDLVSSLTSQREYMNSLIGNTSGTSVTVKNDFSVLSPSVSQDSLLTFALNNRNEIHSDAARISLAEMRYGLAKLQNMPEINFQATGGAKNGFIPDLNKIRPNYVVGISLRVPILDALKNRYRISQAQSNITSVSYEAETTRRNISADVLDASASMNAAKQKISQFQLQLEQAEKAYSLAEISFRSGMITNLDLLDANTAVSETRLLLLKSRIDYAASIYRLKVSLGQKIY
ncbi:MAG TPA: TolC family protein [Bacteroidales bacterium]|nr:TolC family protein [Bacteroidales bacterium]